MNVRKFEEKDALSVQAIYRLAFAGFPWYEDLSREEIEKRWKIQRAKSGFECLVADDEIKGIIVGAIWWDKPTLDELCFERGEHIAQFAKQKIRMGDLLIWERELIVSPIHQGQGVGSQLRATFVESVLNRCEKGVLIFTRMRDDNLPVIKIAEKFGFRKIGIRTPSSQKSGVFHEYWFFSQKRRDR